MRIPMYQIDAFTSEVFAGNPAAVCVLQEWLDDSLLLAIAAENNLSETAFLVRNADGFEIRWCTPMVEVRLCGHATLASAYVVFNHLNWPHTQVRFTTRESGDLLVHQRDGLLEMDFPARPPSEQVELPALGDALGVVPESVWRSEEDVLVVVGDEQRVRQLEPDFASLARVESRGVIVSARGRQCDFVSRFFAPCVGIPEDPVTGSAHCVLVPYWADCLAKRGLHALQVSQRGGELFCQDRGERVSIAGNAVAYLEGALLL